MGVGRGLSVECESERIEPTAVEKEGGGCSSGCPIKELLSQCLFGCRSQDSLCLGWKESSGCHSLLTDILLIVDLVAP